MQKERTFWLLPSSVHAFVGVLLSAGIYLAIMSSSPTTTTTLETANATDSKNKTNSGRIGLVQGEFGCTWKTYNGTLVAGTQGLSFNGFFFLFETTLVLEWESVLRVQDYGSGNLEVLLKNGQTHTFCGLAQKAWLLLITLHNDALLLNRKTTTETPRLQRRKSDPHLFVSPPVPPMDQSTASTSSPASSSTPIPSISYVPSLMNDIPNSTIEDASGLPIQVHDTKCSYRDMKGRLVSGPKALVFTARRGAVFWEHIVISLPWSSVHQVQQYENGIRIRTASRHRQLEVVDFVTTKSETNAVWAALLELHNNELTRTPAGYHHRRRNSDPLAQQLNLVYDTDDGEGDSSIPRASSSRSAPSSPLHSSSGRSIVGPSASSDWETLKSQTLDKTVISNLRLSPCTMDEFFSLFLADTAPHSLSHFLRSRGDTELEATTWNADDERIVRYMHPVNAPLAPPAARARKEQHYERYGNHLVVKTRTVVDDVPMTDCFFVADRILVEPGVEEDGTCFVSVRMEFEITFVKSTMFQGLIRKTTSSEFTDFFQALAEFMRNAVQPGSSSGAAAAGGAPKTPATLADQRPAAASSFPWAAVVHPNCLMFGVVLILQLYILRELQDVKRSIRSLREH